MESALQIPLRDPVAVITVATVVFLAAPLLFDRLRVPRVVGFIAAGALLGPNGLGWLERDQTIVLLGTVGLLYLMFIAAIEIDLHDFRRHRARSLLFGVLGFLSPLVLGFGLSRLLGFSMLGGILLGSMLSSHTLLAYPTASRLGIAKNQP
jgi:Kef-type K+ transport system membrane component KefB